MEDLLKFTPPFPHIGGDACACDECWEAWLRSMAANPLDTAVEASDAGVAAFVGDDEDKVNATT